MPEILIDITRLLSRFAMNRLPTGVDRVCIAYIRQYGPAARAFVHKAGLGGVFSYSASREVFKLLVEPGKHFRLSAVRTMALSPPRPLAGHNGDDCFLFNIGHSGLDQPGYAEWISENRVRPIFMVHDLIPVTHPEYCRPGEFQRHTLRMRTVLKTAVGIVANSRETLRALSGFADACGLAMPLATVAPPGGGILQKSSGPGSLAEPYFVILGTIEPRKNHCMILQVWRRLVERHGRGAPKLVVIGQRGWESENVLDILERCMPLRGVVIELSSCSDAELVCYLRNARALLFPSFAEGYGLPLVEALSLGVPVVASSLPVFREIAGDVPEYLDPLDGVGWMECIEDYRLPDSAGRAAQLIRMSCFAPPAWQDHFKAVENFLEQLRN